MFFPRGLKEFIREEVGKTIKADFDRERYPGAWDALHLGNMGRIILADDIEERINSMSNYEMLELIDDCLEENFVKDDQS